jgi:hypothetical protein
MLPTYGECSFCLCSSSVHGHRLLPKVLGDNSARRVRRICDLVQFWFRFRNLANSAVPNVVLAAPLAMSCLDWDRRPRGRHHLPADPPHIAGYNAIESSGTLGLALVGRLCRIAGGPFFYAASGWHEKALSLEAAKSSIWSLSCGGAGVILAAVAMAFTMIRRDLSRSSLKLVGMALVTFNLVVMALVVTANSLRGLRFEFEFLLPRYLFWSTLFWTGLLLLGIQLAGSKQWSRWLAYLVALALPVMILPMHYRSGVNCRWARILGEAGATSLVNGVRDDEQIRILAPFGGGVSQVYRLAEQLRARRLDMFADGLQDWIGVSETTITEGRYKHKGLSGQCRLAALLECDNGAPAARLTGQLWKRAGRIPHILIIVDQMGVIRGVGHSFARLSENRFVDRVFYLNKTPTSVFYGYIRDYDPQQKYAVRSADGGFLSAETVPVNVPKSMNPQSEAP